MSNTPQTKKGLGTFDFFCVGFGAIVGVGWAVSLNKWMASAGGPVPAALGYLITLVLMVPVGLCFAELVPMLPVAGGGMAFAYKASRPHSPTGRLVRKPPMWQAGSRWARSLPSCPGKPSTW